MADVLNGLRKDNQRGSFKHKSAAGKRLSKITGNNTEIIKLGQEINVTSVYESEGMEQSNTRISEASEDLDMEEI